MSVSDMGELEKHVVAEIRTRKIRTRWPRLLGRNAIFEEHGYGRELLVREIVTDRGASGWGVCRLRPERTPELVGRRLSELFDLFVPESFPRRIRCAFRRCAAAYCSFA